MKGEIKEIIFRNLILMKYKIQEYLEFYIKKIPHRYNKILANYI